MNLGWSVYFYVCCMCVSPYVYVGVIVHLINDVPVLSLCGQQPGQCPTKDHAYKRVF